MQSVAPRSSRRHSTSLVPYGVLLIALALTAAAELDVASNGPLAWRVLAGGLALSLALFAATLARSRARSAAQRSAMELRRSEEQLRLITDAVPALISYIDTKGRYRFNNRAYETWFGKARTDMAGKHMREVMGEDGFRAVSSAFAEAVQGRTIDVDARLRIPSKGTRQVRVSYVPHLGRGGVVEGVVGLVSDRTEERFDEDALELLASAGELLASSLDIEVTLTNVANLALPRLADWCAVEVVQRDGSLKQLAIAHVDPSKAALADQLRERFPASDDGPRADVLKVVRTGRSELYPEITDEMLVAALADPEQLRLARDLGAVSVMIVPLSAGGRTFGAITFLSTESGRRYGQSELATAEELARRAAGALDNARLYREAQDAVRVRDDFLSIASHELKTPLTSLQLQVQHLLRAGKRRGHELAAPPLVLEKLQVVGRQAERLSTLVNELLDISRITAGRLALELEELDLSALVRDVAARFEQDFVRADCTLTLEVEDGVAGLWDPVRLDQVVTNLVSNAIKFGRGSPVAIRLARVGNRARLVVSDSGIGIAEEDQARIFERFERLVSNRHFGGFGIGLWITRQTVEAMQGTIAVRSKPGEGTTFMVDLPLRVQQRLGENTPVHVAGGAR